MAGFCLVPAAVDRFRIGLKSGAIDPAKLSQMSSEERNKFFEDYVGKPNAKDVNALFESKLLLNNQQQGMITWAKSVAGMTERAKQDMVSKISRLDKVLDPEDKTAFLKDLASTKLGVNVTQEEAKTIADLSKRVETTRTAMETGGDRLAFGRAKVDLANYVNDLRVEAQKFSFKGHPVNTVGRAIKRIPGETKAINASMDDSAIFRQGWKTLWTHPGIWQKNARASFGNLVKEFGGKNVLDEMNADIGSRPNAINGKYEKMKLAVGNLEEAFPTTAPEKIPLLGRLYRASEVAYTAFVQKTRADVADKYLEIAEKSGVNTNDKTELESIGKLINSLTGRGSLGKAEPIGNMVNNVFFSPRFLISNINTVTHALGVDVAGGKITPFARKQAAKNLLKIITGTSAIITVANAVHPGSVELDPRSSDFGKIKVGHTRFDVTGGSSSIFTLAARLAPVLIGKAPETKSTTTGQITKLNSGAYGSQTGMDLINNFFDNKLSPVASVVRDVMKGQNQNTGTKPTIGNETSNLFTPLGIQNYEQMKNDPKAANTLMTAIIDGLGINANTFSATQSGNSAWDTSTSKELAAFKSKVGPTEFTQASNEQNTKLNSFLDSIKNDKAYTSLPVADQKTVVANEKSKIQSDIFKQYGFKYKEQRGANKQLKKFLQ